MSYRRDFQLPAEDEEFLDEYGLPWEALHEGSTWLILYNYPVPKGYAQETVTAAVRIETGYPSAPLDMVYFYPPIQRKDGKAINATNATQQLDGKQFQRWSRHRANDDPWTPGHDNIGTHLILVEDWLTREFE